MSAGVVKLPPAVNGTEQCPCVRLRSGRRELLPEFGKVSGSGVHWANLSSRDLHPGSDTRKFCLSAWCLE